MQDGGMARRDDPDDIDALLAEVDRTLGGSSAGSAGPPAKARRSKPAPAGASPVERPRVPLGVRARTAAISGVVGAAVVLALFAFLPFFGAFSGAAGAFLATFITVLVLRRR